MTRLAGFAVLAVVLAGPALAADTYSMDPAHSGPEFEFKHLGVTTQTGRFDRAQGTIVLDRDARTGSVSYEVDAGSINMGKGSEGTLSPAARLFEVGKYPRISFKSSQLIFDGNNAVTGAHGDLTLLGVTRPLTVAVEHFKCTVNPMNRKKLCAGEISATVKRSEWGMVRYIPGISDEVKVRVPVEAYKVIETYTIDPEYTIPVFDVGHLGFTTQRGRFDHTEGRVELDIPGRNGSVDLTIYTNSLDMGARAWTVHVSSEGLFNIEKFPTMTYRSDKLLFDGDAVVAADGEFTLLGVTRPLRVTVNHFACATNPINNRYLCAADIAATIKRSDFGMTKYPPSVSDEIKISVPVEAYRD